MRIRRALTAAFALVAIAASVTTAIAVVPGRATALTVPAADGGSDAKASMTSFLTAVLADTDTYWTRVLEANGYEVPTVTYSWLAAGERIRSACGGGVVTADDAAFYCSADDTIVIGEPFAWDVYEGRLSSWPSGDTPGGRLGDMAVAYVVAHEMAHNIQHEIGLFDGRSATKNLELHADCLAGAWAGDANRRGILDDGDLDEARVTAWLVGDYAFDNPGHHGTPEQRAEAFLDGYESLRSCRTWLTA
jgi:predicted metalloprotease